jgi:hypothetical protein
MRSLIIIGVFVVVMVYVIKQTNNPTPVLSPNLLGPGPTLPPSNVPTVGASYGANTYPGMMGATYTPVPGSPGLLMSVVYSGNSGCS